MARKKKSTWKVPTEARRQARLAAGPPPPGRTIPNKRDKPPKYKKPLVDLAAED
jgi:hypothetical protein